MSDVGTSSTYVKFIQYLVNSSVRYKTNNSLSACKKSQLLWWTSVCGLLCLLFITHPTDRQQWPFFFLYSSSGIDAAIMFLTTVHFNIVFPQRPTHRFCKHKDPHQLLCFSFSWNATRLSDIHLQQQKSRMSEGWLKNSNSFNNYLHLNDNKSNKKL